LKPDVPTVEPAFAGRHDRERTVKSLGFSQMPSFAEANKGKNQTGSGLYHSIVKELVLPGLQEGLRTNPYSTDIYGGCQEEYDRTKGALWITACANS
jgi:hypothetical protein